MTRQEPLFEDATRLQQSEQYRMRRLQVYNWGTFSGLHDIRIAEAGFLFVGRSGSGKSTLLDALAALLIPPQWLSFNAAAREGERGGRQDRNWASYVRGAWADQKDLESGEIATRYLRKGTTWSALAVTFSNEAGRTVSLVQLHWLRGAATGNSDVRRHYMVAERDFDIAQELEGFDLDMRGLKRRFDELDHYDNFRPYGERFRRLLGIESEMALKLLHKTQSAKNLGDLNAFLREFMLDRPRTFEVADRLVAEFAELDAAHQEVVTARQQVETLRPARADYERVMEIDTAVNQLKESQAGVDRYSTECKAGLIQQEIENLRTREQGLAGEEQHRTERLEAARESLETLEAEHRNKGGDRIETLEQRRAEMERQRGERQRRWLQVEAACRQLDWPVPDNATAFAERVAEARELVEEWETAFDRLENQRDALRDEKKQIEMEFTAVRHELEALERQPSNIPARMLAMRQKMVESLGLTEADLPFVGELIQVREDAAEWRGAIERVLHGFGLSLLVDARHYAAVSSYVDEIHLGGRLVYYKVDDEIRSGKGDLHPQSLIRKLELRDTTYRPWLQSELMKRFDYLCVENLRDFRQARRAVTRAGQVRHGPDRHEKDDRQAVNDRTRWVLGFDNREKRALYRERAQQLATRITEFDRNIEAIKDQRDTKRRRFEAAHSMINLRWEEIDVAAALDRLHELEGEIERLRSQLPALQELSERIARQRQAVKEADEELRNVRVEREGLVRDLNACRRELEQVEDELEVLPELTPLQRERLEQAFQNKGAVSLKNLEARHREVEKAIHAELEKLHEERGKLQRAIERAFDSFKRQWPHAGADMDPSLEAAPEFMALLQRLERDGLPRHEQRFFDMLKEQSSENLAALNTHLSQARKEIYERMELVNEGLAGAEFNTGTYLQIKVTDRQLPDVREFRDQVQQVLAHAWQADRQEAETRFLILRDLVQRLGGQESEQRRWREQVLDVRLHVEFVGHEYDSHDREVEVYRSGSGKSGGQREKLSTTCLAAALRYQLGGMEGDLPVYAPVVLDEAFGKADNEFTELGMKIFEKFGFQMVVATPLKSVMTLEPFIGGACFVDITDRRHSATLPIEYDQHQQRLRLPARDDGQSVSA